MKQDHSPWDEKTFHAGANTDVEGIAVARAAGTYRDASNMRCADNLGNNTSLVKIGGEVKLEPTVHEDPGGPTYVCIGSISVKGRKVAFWASTQPGLYPPIVKVDGITVARSPLIPYTWDKKLQLHKMEDCEGGMVFDARSGGVPIHWNIGLLLSAYDAGMQTYFTDFDLSMVSVNMSRPVNRPVFNGFIPVGAGAGVASGQYWYWIHYVNLNGDRTPDGPPLGPVMVPWHGDHDTNEISPAMPSAHISGVDLSLSLDTPAGIGVKLSFRVNNLGNFDTIEVVRQRWSANAGVDAVGVVEVVHRQNVDPGENHVYDIIDDGHVLASISGDDAQIHTYFIEEANSVRYIDYHVVYGGVKLGGKDVNGDMVSPPGSRIVPFTKSIGDRGHSDPINHCYHRRFMSGERYGFGVVYYGPDGGESMAQSIEDNFLMPSRRTKKEGLSLAYSDYPCNAANTSNEVSPTFEVFDHDDASGKSLSKALVNIMKEGRRRKGGWSNDGILEQTPGDLQETLPVYTDHSANPNDAWYKTAWGVPLTPTKPQDWKWGLDYQVNTFVNKDGRPNAHAGSSSMADAGNWSPYNPKVWGVRHHTLGAAFTGIQTPPTDMQGFSVVSTPAAGRVVAQGLWMWDLKNDSDPVYNQPKKSQNSGLLCIPDFLAGLVNQSVWEGIASGQGYKIQFVSPLGFSSEQYASTMMATIKGAAGAHMTDAGCYSDLADMLSVARVIWDSGQINPGNTGGIQPSTPLPPASTTGAPPSNYTGFGTWRNPQLQWPPTAPPGNTDGDAMFGIVSGSMFTHQSGIPAMRVTLDTNCYQTTGTGNSSDFRSAQVKAFHEPWYVVNIIEDGKIPDTTKGYISLNHYQAFRSVIGVSNGVTDAHDGQMIRLADENMDMISALPGQERYVHVIAPPGTLNYVNIAGQLAPLTTILSDISANGYWTAPSGKRVHGLYSIVHVDGIDYVNLGCWQTPPPPGHKVEVRYDPSIPVKVFGDRVTSPSLATIADASTTVALGMPTNNPQDRDSQDLGSNTIDPKWLIWKNDWFGYGESIRTSGLPIPFANYEYNGYYMVPFNAGFVGDFVSSYTGMEVNKLRSGRIQSVRQWKVLFDCEMQAPLFLSRWEDGVVGNSTSHKSWPSTNYIPRPYMGSVDVHDNYDAIFGSHERDRWRFGGFRSDQLPTFDHDLLPGVRYYAKPKFGYQERTDLCNALVWSAKDSPLMQDMPGLKTFPVSNIEFLENDKGAIERLFSSSPGNLFAIMSGQVLEVLVQKSTAYSADGESFSLYAQDNFVGQVIPRSKFAGMPGTTWKTAAEGGAFTDAGKVDALVWYDGETAYMLAGGQVADIAQGTYRNGLAAAWDSGVAGGGIPRISGAYDGSHNEFWMSLGGGVVPSYLNTRGMSHWQGWYGYKFDDLLFSGGKMYGFRELSTYELNVGDTMNGASTLAWVKVATAPANDRMEWVRIKLNSPRKPSRIEWYDEEDVLVAWMDEATFGPYYIKKETSGSWAQWVPRKNIVVDTGKRRIQGRLAYYKVMYSDAGPDKIITSGAQVKMLS